MPSSTLVSVVGARPQFIKLAPVCRSLADLAVGWEHCIIHTGQHYDHGMSDVFFEDLDIPRPDVNLNIGSGKQGEQTAAMISGLEREFEKRQPAGVIVYGDTNSTLGATIAASKMGFPLFHVEAGLRSFDRSMPEEVNRIVADHCSELLFAPTGRAMENLRTEGLQRRAMMVGDVMYDAIVYNSDIARQYSNVLEGLDVDTGSYAVVTIHRAASTTRTRLLDLMKTLEVISNEFLPVVFPMHPRTRAVLGESLDVSKPGLRIIEPQPYIDMLALVQNARMVLTDSGGLQKEAAFLGVPCVTLRDTTEWTETVEIGANRLAGFERGRIIEAVRDAQKNEPNRWQEALPKLFGDGRAADRIASALVDRLSSGRGERRSA